MNSLTDEALLDLLRSPHREERNRGLSYSYENFYKTVTRHVLNNNGTLEDAKDIFQDGLIILYEKVQNPNFVQSSSLKTYLYGICKNIWYAKLRKESKREVPINNLQELNNLPDLNGYEEERYVEEKERLSDYYLQLGEGCRKILFLFYFQRRSMREIADKMNLANEKVAKNKKARCMIKLKAMFLKSSSAKK